MYPKAIESYYAPTSIAEALSILAKHNNEAKLLAGGQSLLPMLKLRLAEPRVLIDLNHIGGLDQITERNGALYLGAMARHRDVAEHPLVRSKYPIVADAARAIGDPQVRNRGTIGGSLVHADPAADYPVAMLALEARIKIENAEGTGRTLSADEFLLGPMMSAIGNAEMVTEIELPTPAPRSAGAYIKHSIVAGDFALVSAGVQLELDDSNLCKRAIIVIGGLISRPACVPDAAQALIGRPLDDSVFKRAGEIAARQVEAGSDVRASGTYRRSLIASYVPGVIQRAVERARN